MLLFFSLQEIDEDDKGEISFNQFRKFFDTQKSILEGITEEDEEDENGGTNPLSKSSLEAR